MSIKRYAPERLYRPDEARYVPLDELGRMLSAGGTIVVRDARADEDITRSVVEQIISEQANHG